MYELIILGFLMRSNSHGYRISKIINDMIGPYAKISSGRLYPLFEKLSTSGFITIVQDVDNSQSKETRQREYEITEGGKNRFRQLMMDTTTNMGEYRKLFGFKFIFIDLLQVSERLYLLDHYINYCQTHIFYIESEMEDLQHRPVDYLTTSLNIMEHNKSKWLLEIQWANSYREQLKGGDM
ncbi:PadR family transcriptional regulator [Paenibacillus popilliae]|uniref:PadR family transcriptional regulator n=1 Tax=Paenibacillus popilliae TaxID=78057 RepID=A0ABY3B0K2_PAEPP|nr:PadR family transcriptional regulator [Paenibacillus sp. SDF0028]TQR46401.1 PadR family transcriptional regulator [Paenibacillus sp. SDF0028]